MAEKIIKNKENNVTIQEQLKKFAIKGLYGYQSVLTFGIGRRLGIFTKLLEVATKGLTRNNMQKTEYENNDIIVNKNEYGEVVSLSFTPDKVAEILNFKKKTVTLWLKMGITTGIFEVDTNITGHVKTAPYTYKILIDNNDNFYLGDVIGLYYDSFAF